MKYDPFSDSHCMSKINIKTKLANLSLFGSSRFQIFVNLIKYRKYRYSVVLKLIVTLSSHYERVFYFVYLAGSFLSDLEPHVRSLFRLILYLEMVNCFG